MKVENHERKQTTKLKIKKKEMKARISENKIGGIMVKEAELFEKLEELKNPFFISLWNILVKTKS